MSERFKVDVLPEVDQRMIKRGMCPWCIADLIDNGKEDECPDCGDAFHGTLTIED